MIYFHGTTDFYTDSPSAVTLGKFDGVHLGHQKLMEKVRALSENGIQSVVFAINAKTTHLILTREEQRQVLEDIGVDVLIDCPFIPEIFTMTPEGFVQKILLEKLHAKHIVVGTDFRFGHDRAGSAQYLKENEKRFGYTAHIIEKEKYHGREISSTYVREALARGEMETVTALMGRPYPVHGTVVHGRHLGTEMGMPTANLVPTAEKLLPPNGVYYSRVSVDGKEYSGVTNIGYKPTIGEKFKGVETYILDRDIDLYGKYILVSLEHFVRPEKKFDSIEQLRIQIQKDISLGRKYFE